MTDHLVGVNGVVQIDPNEVLGIERDEGVVTGASVLLWPGRWRIALREGSGGSGGGGGAVSSVAGRTGAVVLSSADLTDATATGRSVLTAADAAAARTAIGAGTSSLVIGTGAGNAKAGNYAPPDATGAVRGLVQLAGDLTGTAASPALANTAVTPGSYTLASITVDSKGRITAASSGAAGSVADATTTSKGVVQLAGDLAGTAAAPTVVAASETVAGKVELATTAEATAGTDTARAVTPAGLKAGLDTKAPLRTTPTEVTGATYTLAASDENTGIRTTSATAVTVTVPSTLPVGYVCPILVDGAGMVTVVAGSGVTLVHAEPPVSRKQGSALAVQMVAAGRAWVVGDFA